MSKPSAYALWKQAGGETDRFDRDEYRRLMVEHGLLIPLEPNEKAEPLPCGWPHHTPDMTHGEATEERAERIRRQAMRDHPFAPDERDPRYCGHWSGSSRTSDAGTLTFRAQCGYPPDLHPYDGRPA